VVILFIASNYPVYPQNTQNSHFHQIIHPISPNHNPISIGSVTIGIRATEPLRLCHYYTPQKIKNTRSGVTHYLFVSVRVNRRWSERLVAAQASPPIRFASSNCISWRADDGSLWAKWILWLSSCSSSSLSKLLQLRSSGIDKISSEKPLARWISESSLWRREPARAASGDTKKTTHDSEHLCSLKWSGCDHFGGSIRGQRNKKNTNGATHVGFTAETFFSVS
jgi:hypothetical protein